MQDCFLSSCQPEQEAPDQGGRGGGQPPLRPHWTAGRRAAQRCSAGTGSGCSRGAASVTPPDTGGWRGLAGAAAVAGAATAAPTSFSGHARRTRKAPRRALGGRSPRAPCRPPAPSASLRGLASGGGTGRGSFRRPDLSSPGSPPRRGTFSRPSVCWRSPGAALYPSNSEPNSFAQQQVLATLPHVPQIRPSPKSLQPPYPSHHSVPSKLGSVSTPDSPIST